MQILNYSKTLTKQERCERFKTIIDMDMNKTDKEIVGNLVGANLIWARATFDKKSNEMVQANSWVNLKVEIFTKVRGDIEFENVSILFNNQKFDFEQPDVVLNKTKPFVIEKNIYLDESMLNLEGEVFVLKQLFLKLKEKPIRFTIIPYLTAKEVIRGKLDKKGAGLKKPVMISFESMPQKLNFDIKYEKQGLIGNR
jgi:hypothetical protein